MKIPKPEHFQHVSPEGFYTKGHMDRIHNILFLKPWVFNLTHSI